MPLNIHKMHF